jgi:hypothetical protein
LTAILARASAVVRVDRCFDAAAAAASAVRVARPFGRLGGGGGDAAAAAADRLLPARSGEVGFGWRALRRVGCGAAASSSSSASSCSSSSSPSSSLLDLSSSPCSGRAHRD